MNDNRRYVAELLGQRHLGQPGTVVGPLADGTIGAAVHGLIYPRDEVVVTQ